MRAAICTTRITVLFGIIQFPKVIVLYIVTFMLTIVFIIIKVLNIPVYYPCLLNKDPGIYLWKIPLVRLVTMV